MRNFYIVFDDENSAVAIAPSVTSLSTSYTAAELGMPSRHFGPAQIRNRMLKRLTLTAG